MTFENHTRGEHHEKNRSANDSKALEKEELKAENELSKDEPLLQPKKTGQPDETVGYVGGQAADDERGLDITQYTGPGSKPSSAFKDPKAPYHQGPGSGLSDDEKSQEADWENPEPENDSF